MVEQPDSYAYQWQDCSSLDQLHEHQRRDRLDATRLQSSDVGKTVDVVVTATNAGGSASGDLGPDQAASSRLRTAP